MSPSILQHKTIVFSVIGTRYIPFAEMYCSMCDTIRTPSLTLIDLVRKSSWHFYVKMFFASIGRFPHIFFISPIPPHKP